MERSPVLGIVYSKFDEKLGPKPSHWCPESVPEETRNRVASESMGLSFGRDQVPEALAIIPLPGLSLKAYVKYGSYPDAARRGRVCDITLCLLFGEENDIIFYKYIHDFQHLFDKYAKLILQAEADKAGSHAVSRLVDSMYSESAGLVDSFRAQEMAPREATAFPDADDDQSQSPRKETLKFKCIICGDPAVGKTSLVLRFTDKAFKRTYMPTLGTNITDKIVEFPDHNLSFQLWDVAGQAKFARFRKSFYGGAAGYVLVFDLTQPETLKSVYAWSNDIRSLIGEMPGLILGNKHDLVDQRQVPDEAIAELSQAIGMPVVLTSALTGENVDEAFKELGFKIVERARKK
ncbi:MAG: GTP-binding protein [Candidatus Lokiarchaeota archaeon]|nr:GTP-binding protein [Candidatus Lokiarchaeota archaeon]